MSGGGRTNTVQTADPWIGLQPYMASGFEQAANIYQNNPSAYYPGQTYMPMNPMQTAAMDAQLGNITDLQNISGASQQGLGTMLGAADLRNNPYAQQYAGAVGGNLASNIGTTINQMGRGFTAQGQDLGLQNQSLIDQQIRGLGAAGNQYSNQIADLIGQQDVAYGGQANQFGLDLQNLAQQQQRDYDVQSNRLTEDLFENTLTGIASDAVGAGQSGSSRQGVAEGIALGKFGQSLSDLARAQSENMGAFGRQGALSLGNLSATQGQQLGSAVRSGLTSLGDIGRAGQETIGQNVFTGMLGQNQLAREQAGQLGDVAENLTSQAGQDIAGFMSDQYGQGLEAVGRGLGLAPSTAAMTQAPYESLYQVGDILQQQQRLPLQEAMDRYYYNQQAPWQDLSNYVAAINSLPISGGQMSSSTNTPGSAMGGAIGGGMTGYALGSMIGGGAGAAGGAAGGAASGSSMGPWGALAGAVLGALMSR